MNPEDRCYWCGGIPEMVTRRGALRKPICWECKDAAKYEQAARLIIQIFNQSRVPDFVTNAILPALNEASGMMGINVWQSEGAEDAEDFDLKALANLFSKAEGLDLNDDRSQFTRNVLALLHNEATPGDLREAVAQWASTESNMDDFAERQAKAPETIRALVEQSCDRQQEVNHVAN